MEYTCSKLLTGKLTWARTNAALRFFMCSSASDALKDFATPSSILVEAEHSMARKLSSVGAARWPKNTLTAM
eukprot:11843842-Alexandrium_andersonii.AAC.1